MLATQNIAAVMVLVADQILLAVVVVPPGRMVMAGQVAGLMAQLRRVVAAAVVAEPQDRTAADRLAAMVAIII